MSGKIRLPRCRGFRYAPRIHAQNYNGNTVYRVQQRGFWMDAFVVGPTKPTEAEAIASWRRLVKAKNTVADAREGGRS